jgi:hypothetical protein
MPAHHFRFPTSLAFYHWMPGHTDCVLGWKQATTTQKAGRQHWFNQSSNEMKRHLVQRSYESQNFGGTYAVSVYTPALKKELVLSSRRNYRHLTLKNVANYVPAAPCNSQDKETMGINCSSMYTYIFFSTSRKCSCYRTTFAAEIVCSSEQGRRDRSKASAALLPPSTCHE